MDSTNYLNHDYFIYDKRSAKITFKFNGSDSTSVSESKDTMQLAFLKIEENKLSLHTTSQFESLITPFTVELMMSLCNGKNKEEYMKDKKVVKSNVKKTKEVCSWDISNYKTPFLSYNVSVNILLTHYFDGELDAPYNLFATDPSIMNAKLKIGDYEIYVNKLYLSFFSNYFNALFNENFREAVENNYVLDYIDVRNFIELLNVISPHRKPINSFHLNDISILYSFLGENYEYLLEMADFFEIPFVFDACENFLLTFSEISNVDKLLIADQYSLIRLMDDVLHKLHKECEISKLDVFEELGEVTKKCIMDSELMLKENK